MMGKDWVLPPLTNSWIIIMISLYIALNRTPNIDCYWVGAVPKVRTPPRFRCDTNSPFCLLLSVYSVEREPASRKSQYCVRDDMRSLAKGVFLGMVPGSQGEHLKYMYNYIQNGIYIYMFPHERLALWPLVFSRLISKRGD